MEDESTNVVIGSIVLCVFVGSLILAALSPKFEADAFNRCTGGHATYFDAVFTELRVTECK